MAVLTGLAASAGIGAVSVGVTYVLSKMVDHK